MKILAAILALTLLQLPSAFAGDPVVVFRSDDPKMDKAIEDARATLIDLLATMRNGDAEYELFSLKVAIPTDDGGREHVFLSDIELLGENNFAGSLDNDPNDISGLRYGDRYEFSFDQISDWLYVEDGKLHGAYTVRVMLPRLPKEEADFYRSVLAPLPIKEP